MCLRLFAWLCASVIALCGCASTPDEPASPLTQSRWQMVEASFRLAPPPAPRPTLELRGDRLSAASGCNLAMARYRDAGARLEITALAATRRACVGEVERVEQAYFGLLNESPRYRFEGASLILQGERSHARFIRLPEGGEAISLRLDRLRVDQ